VTHICKPGELKIMQQTQIAYIAGLFDGEACFCCHLTNVNKNYSTGGSVSVNISVQACSLAMIDTCISFYDELGVRCKVETGRWMPKSTRPVHKVEVRRKADVKRVLETLLPYLCVKKPEAEAILSWLDKWGHDLRGRNQHNARITPGKKEKLLFIDQVRGLKNVA
jgi:hypothetical protein